MKNKRFFVYTLPFIFAAMVVAYGANDTDTSDSIVSKLFVGGNQAYQYRIAAATTAWYSEVIDVRQKEFVAFEIYKATGSISADRTGTVGTGDFYLRGLVDAGSYVSADNGVLPSSVSPAFVVPYYYGPMAGLGVAGYISGTTSIDVYGLNLYDVRGLTHVYVYVSTNNADNTVVVAVE